MDLQPENCNLPSLSIIPNEIICIIINECNIDSYPLLNLVSTLFSAELNRIHRREVLRIGINALSTLPRESRTAVCKKGDSDEIELACQLFRNEDAYNLIQKLGRDRACDIADYCLIFHPPVYATRITIRRAQFAVKHGLLPLIDYLINNDNIDEYDIEDLITYAIEINNATIIAHLLQQYTRMEIYDGRRYRSIIDLLLNYIKYSDDIEEYTLDLILTGAFNNYGNTDISWLGRKFIQTLIKYFCKKRHVPIILTMCKYYDLDYPIQSFSHKVILRIIKQVKDGEMELFNLYMNKDWIRDAFCRQMHTQATLNNEHESAKFYQSLIKDM